MKKTDLYDKLNEIQISLAVIEKSLTIIEKESIESKVKIEANEKKIDKLETFKDKAMGATMIGIPLIAFLSAVGHDIIKQFMGWG
jgi:phosphopentomutase